ncbi:uncharacterized protein LOC134191287 [Corticium candelabrum]|uniref:uncharacterized protein LOC134191287 n=1 Tax=Corticium candelabrum TaxID=121492 RepID=UPI002E2586CE|nr:uncharacterized protein LOC134191287 [Corticium candelabrum]
MTSNYIKFAKTFLKEALDLNVSDTLKKCAQLILEIIKKLIGFADEAKNSTTKAKMPRKCCWDTVDIARDLAQDLACTVMQYADWGSSEERIMRVKSAVEAGDFRAFESFMDTLTTHLRQIKEIYESSSEAAQEAKTQACTAAENVEKEANKAKSERKFVQGVGGTASGLLIGGGVAGIIATAVFPPAGGAVAAALACSGAAASGGVATAVVTGLYAEELRKTAKQLETVGELLEYLSNTAATLFTIVRRLNSWVKKSARTMEIACTAARHAENGYPYDLIDAVELFHDQSGALRVDVCKANNELQQIKTRMKQKSR